MAEKCLPTFVADTITTSKNFLNAVEVKIRSKANQSLDIQTSSSLCLSEDHSTVSPLKSVSRSNVETGINSEMKNEMGTVLKDDDSGSGSSEDIPSEQNSQQRQINQRNHESVGIYLETPVVDENNVCLVGHDFEKAKPKRLSDDFFSSDDGDDEKSAIIENKSEVIADKISEDIHCEESNSGNFIAARAREFCEEDTSSSCSNLLSRLNNEESPLLKSSTVSECLASSSNQVSGDNLNVNNSESAVALYENDVQSMDAIERRDFEHEQRMTGGVILKTSSLVNSDNQLNLEYLKSYKDVGRMVSSDSKSSFDRRDIASTPTSSRCNTRLTKSTAKLNLSTTLDRLSDKTTAQQPDKSSVEDRDLNAPCTSKDSTSSGESSSASQCLHKHFDVFLNSNSNDSLSSDKSYNTSSNHSLPNFFHKGSRDTTTSQSVGKDNSKQSKEDKHSIESDSNNLGTFSNPIASTSSHSTKCQYPTFCCEDSAKAARKEATNNYRSSNEAIVKLAGFVDKKSVATSTITSQESKGLCSYSTGILFRNCGPSQLLNATDSRNFESSSLEAPHVPIVSEPIENDFDDETWADCEEGSDEEICTCYNNEYQSRNTFEEDFPSRDVDLSSYIQMVSISEDMFLQDTTSPDLPPLQRKRKLNESRVLDLDSPYGDSSALSRKRMAFDYTSSPRSSHTPAMASPSTPLERRTPRSLIPTKDNPPPELQDWLLQFQRWSHAERLLAVDRLIEHCEPTQVRHMMKVIEPQFQRDFISLLPRELALQVLSYLEPKDLLRAAQTCRSWRYLCDDNLLWKEKCRQAQILTEPKSDKPKRGRAGNMPPISSPWKAAYMRQHIIEMNWRSRPIRQPKILKGHDDHVITCLQFCGNRIVSGSDDNTLKVWSAVTGKCLRTLVGHTGGVWSSQMSGNIIISGSTDRTLKVWDMETGQCIHTLLGHTSTVRCMHLHGKKVVSGSRDATLRVWDIEQGTCLHVLVGHLAAVRCVQYDGKLIVSGAYDYMVKVWHPERQECLHTLQGHTNRVYSLQFDGIHVVSGSLDTSIRVWDAETGNCKHTLMGHQSLTSGMELRQNILVSGNADSTVKVWDITTGQCLQTLSGPNKHQSAVTCLQFNSRFVITSSDDGTVKLWDVKTGEFIRNLVALESGGSGGVVWRIRASDTKLICAVGSRNGTEETKLMVLDFDVEGACLKCS